MVIKLGASSLRKPEWKLPSDGQEPSPEERRCGGCVRGDSCCCTVGRNDSNNNDDDRSNCKRLFFYRPVLSRFCMFV